MNSKLKSAAKLATKVAGKRVAQAVAVHAFAKKAPIIGGLLASEEVIKKLAHASHDLLAGHPVGARNELQQAITHAVGAGVNILGGASIAGMTAGVVAQTLAQQHAATIAANKPIAPQESRTLYGKLADQANLGISFFQTVMIMREQWKSMLPQANQPPQASAPTAPKARTAKAAKATNSKKKKV